MSQTPYGTSMRDEIAKAKSKEEIDSLLVKCTTFKNSSPDTVRKWDRAARLRIASIEKGVQDA